MQQFNQPGVRSRVRSNPTASACTIERLEDRQLCSHYVNGSHGYADHTFLDSNWTLTAFPLGNGGTTSASQQLKGGHPGKYRLVTDIVYAGGDGSALYGFHGNTKAIFDPAKSGAITSLYYAEDNRLISGFGEGEGTGPALEQNGVVYFLLDRLLITPQTKWARLQVPNLTAANFTTLDGTAHPDFSQTAAPIEFGFQRSNSPGGSAGYTITAGIDNWTVRVKTRKFIP